MSTNARDPRLVAVIGALETFVSRAVESKPDAGVRADADLARILLAALDQPLPLTRGTAASALGKMRWRPAWRVLKDIVEDLGDGASDTRRMRASACYACDQLTEVIDKSQLAEAERLFRGRLRDTAEVLTVRRPSASGIVKLMRRGHRSEGLTNDLLWAAQDQDEMVARSALVGLIQLEPAEIFADAVRLLSVFNAAQKQIVCAAARGQPTRTGLMLISRLLEIESHPHVLASALDAVREVYKRTREGTANLGDFGLDVELLESLGSRSLRLSEHDSPHIIASSLGVFQELTHLEPFRRGGSLFRLRQLMLAGVRGLLGHEHSSVQSSACFTVAALGAQEDLESLQALRDGSPSRKVQDSARGAYDFLKRRLGVG